MDELQLQALTSFYRAGISIHHNNFADCFQAESYGNTGNRIFFDVHRSLCDVVCERCFAKSDKASVYC
jgi:hypothetical protein